MGFGSRGKSCSGAIGSRIFGWVGVEQSAEHSYEVVLVVRSVAVRRHTRFRVEGGYFPAAAGVGVLHRQAEDELVLAWAHVSRGAGSGPKTAALAATRTP